MEHSLDQITQGKLSPSIFPFYHIGVTVSAASSSATDDDDVVGLEAPSIINGCQTIAIANEYLKRLERQKNDAALDLFRQIKVIAKVVVSTTNDELKEITNSNNRQNPIENWQLFSNEPIHIEIEATLKDIGVFYERQKGKFESVMKNADNAKHYWNTNGTYIKVVDLAQVIALSRSNLQWAAKPSDIFANKENHDRMFDRSIPRYPHDIVFVSNLFRAMKRGLNNYLELPTHANSNAPVIFKKPIVRHQVYRLAILHFYQNSGRASSRADYSSSLTKIANAKLVDDVQAFYQRVVLRTRTWYSDESRDLTTEISKKKMETFFGNFAFELGLDPNEGAIPFTSLGLDGLQGQRGQATK
jgi:AIPR protein